MCGYVALILRRRISIFLALLLLICSACSDGGQNQQGAVTHDSDNLVSEIEAISNRLTREDFSGTVFIAKNGEIILNRGYGFADRENNLPNTPQTKFPYGKDL